MKAGVHMLAGFYNLRICSDRKEEEMNYCEVSIFTSSSGVEPLSNALVMGGYYSFSIDDVETARDILSRKKTFEWDYYDESVLEEREAVITLYFEPEGAEEHISAVQNIAAELKASDNEGEYGRLAVVYRNADDAEWKDEWKQYFKPYRVTDDIVIRPSWEEYEPEPGDKVIEIDPGMAFGTGTHATTRMCIDFLEKNIEPEDRVMDIGCGSGILSIAAALCGAAEVSGFDIDPDAVEASLENAEKNGLSGKIEISQGDVTKGLGRKADIIAANLMAELVMMIAPSVAEHLEGKKIFISSGIITEKRDQVKKSLEDAGFVISEISESEGWCAVKAVLPE